MNAKEMFESLIEEFRKAGIKEEDMLWPILRTLFFMLDDSCDIEQ